MNTVTQLLFALVLAGATFWLFDDLNDQLDSTRTERDQAQYERDGLREAARITGKRLAIAAANDLKHTQELKHELDDTDGLQRGVGDGRKRLLVKATCSAAVPTSASTAGVADARTAELAADARPDYFTLRRELALSRQMILGLQDHLRLCPTTPTATGATQ